MMDWNCSGWSMPESRRYSSSVRMVLSERFAAAGSPPIFIYISGLGCGYRREKEKEIYMCI